MKERVTCTIDDQGIADVRLNRPEKHNGLDLAMFEALARVGEGLADNRAVRAVIVSGEGPSFCAGLDFKSFMAEDASAQTRLLERPAGTLANRAQQIAWVWTEVPVPVIAAVHGACLGGGLQLALAADLRVAHPSAKLSVKEINYGLIPDMSITCTLGRLVRLDVAKLLTFTGRELGGQEALQLGLVTELSDTPLAEARSWAEAIATRSPHAIRAAKKLWQEAPALSSQEALLLETELQLPLLGSKNQLEAVMAHFQKRRPEFEDPS